MSEYRFYFIEPNGHIAKPAKILDCQHDEAAVTAANQLLKDHDVEIWQGARIVAYVVPRRRRPDLGT